MRRRRFLGTAGAVALTSMVSAPAIARSVDPMTGRAADLLESLSPEQRRVALLPFDGDVRRDWHYTPRRRPGLPLKAMTGEQRDLTWDLIEAALSEAGRRKARGIIQIEAILGELTGRPSYRDPKNYALAIFGEPTARTPWGWRMEGHHLSLTFTVVPGQGVAVTPAFFGTNPAEVPHGHSHAGLRVLKAEHDLAFGLINGLSDTQRDAAVIADRSLGNIVTGPGREQSLRQPEGLDLAGMDETHRALTLKLVETYLGNMRADLAGLHLDRMREAGIDRLHFAWAGSLEPSRPHYYRLHGPTLVVEYDNTQNGANHVHSVWHDPLNGFGEDMLRAHHERDHRG